MAEPELTWLEKALKFGSPGIYWLLRKEKERAARLASEKDTDLEEKAAELFPGFGEESTKIQTHLTNIGREQEELLGMYEFAALWAAEPTTALTKASLAGGQQELMSMYQRYGYGPGNLPLPAEDYLGFLEADISILDTQVEADEWKLVVMARIPELVLKGDVQTFDQVLDIAPPPGGVSDADLAFVEEIFNKVATPSISGITPFKIITPEEKATEEQLKFLEQSGKAVPVGLHQLTVDEILKSMDIEVMPIVPSGLTLEEIRAGLRSAGLSDIEIDEFTADSVEKLSSDWAEVTALHEAFRTGITEATAPALTHGQRAKLLILQPIVSIGEALDIYFNAVPRPLAAAVLTNAPGIRETRWSRDMTEMVEDFKLQGEGSWTAYQRAFVESDANWGLKLLLEILFDPTTYIGFGILTKALKPFPRLSVFMGAVEKGWLDMWNGFFLLPVALIKKVPMTTAQMAGRSARAAVIQMHADLGRAVGRRTGAGMSLASAKEVLLKQLGIFERDSMGAILTGDCQTARHLLERQPIERATIEHWLERLGLEGVEVTDQSLMDIHYIIEKQLQGIPISNREIAQEILFHALGVDDTIQVWKHLPKMQNLLDDFKKARFARARSVIESANSMPELQKNVFNEVEHIATVGFGNPAYLEAQKFGKITSFVHKIERSSKFSAIRWIDRQVTIPMAKQYLMFMNYGPFNVLETIFRGFLGGGRTIYPRSAKPSETLIRLTKGLSIPYEFYEASGRMEMAVLLEGTTSTMYAPGKLPGITKPLVVNGKRLGTSFKLAGKEYPINSLQDFNRYIADVQTQMRAYYFQEKYLQFLGEANPDIMAELHRLSPKLSNMGFSKYFGRNELKDMEQLLERSGTINPDVIRDLADLPLKEMENNKALATTDKILDTYPDLDPMFKETIREGISTGAVWKDIDGFTNNLSNTIREFYLQKLESATLRLDELSKAMVTTPIKDGDHLISRLGDIGDFIRSTESMVTDARMTAQINARRLTPAGRRAFHRANYKQIAKFMEGVETNIDYMQRELNNIMKGGDYLMDWSKVEFKGMTASQQADVKMWIDNLPLEIKGKLEAVAIDSALLNKRGWGAVFITSKTEGSRGVIYKPGTIVIREGQQERLFYHEMMHSIQAEKIATGDYKFLLDWADTVYGKGSEESKFIQRMADSSTDYAHYFGEEIGKWEAHGARPSESMTNAFEEYATGKKMLAKHSNFFDEHLPIKYPRLTLAPEQQQFAMDLLDNYVTQTKIWTKARMDEWDITERLLANEPGKGASKLEKNAFWEDFSFQRNLPWDEARRNMIQVKNQEAKLLGRLSQTGTAPPLALPHPMEFTGELTPAHIAHIFQVTGDDMSKAGLVKLESMTMRSRAEFTDMVRTQATAVGDKHGKTLEQMGFTDEAIGKCYDQMVRGVGLDPAALEPLTPILKPVESINKELHAVYASKAMPEADYKLWQESLTKYADDLGGMDIHKAGTDSYNDWWGKKQAAIDKAQVEYSLSFTDYTNQNAFDALMKVIYPFWCVPEYATILTKMGWKHYSELQIGEDVLTVNPDTLTTSWEPLEKLAVFDYDDELVVIPAKGKGIEFTPNHRWLTINKRNGCIPSIKKGYQLTDGYDMIPRALPHNFPEESILTEREAAILGWACTDGYIRHNNNRKSELFIYQSVTKFVSDILEATGTKAYPRSRTTDPNNMVIRVSQVDSDKILSICPNWNYLPEVVSKLSMDAAESMWDAMFKAEGNSDNGWMRFKQNPGPVKQAFEMLSVLLGKAITSGSNTVYMTQNGKPYQSKEARRMFTKHYKGKVWCPVTPSGTWFMNCNGSILPTGNTYESQRWMWVPREFLRRPGLATAMGKYTDYSDQGYVNIPGTDIQFNLLRGTVFMGGFRRLRLRDYPEYYDLFPGMEIIDFGQRLGFYPGAPLMGAIVLTGAASPKHRAEFGEIFPAWLNTGLDAVRSIAPEEVERMMQTIFPDRFRDYQIMMEVSNRGGDGYAIWRKLQDNVALTDEEEQIWYSASKHIAIFGIAAQQTGFLRFRPEDLNQWYEDSASLIEKMTGIPVDVQETIREHQAVTGDRLQDIYPLSPLEQKILYELEGYDRWAGRITPLLPSAQQDMANKISSYWDDVGGIHDAAYEKGFFGVEGKETLPSLATLNTQFVNGEISPSEWLSMSGGILSRVADSIEDLSGSALYADVPKTVEERIAYFEKLYGSVPVYHPAKELLWMYYQLQPEMAYDEDAGTYQRDFDSYYAHIDHMVEALPEDQQEEFLATIQYNWTPTQKLYWWVSREYLRPYRNVRQLVLTDFSPEEQAIIERWYVAPTGEKQALQEEIHAVTGNKLISEFQSRLTTARKNLRLIDPELDAWVCFWKDLKPLSPQAEVIFADLRSKYIK